MNYTQLNQRFNHRVTALVTYIDRMDPVQLAIGAVIVFLWSFSAVFGLALWGMQ